MDFLEVIQKRHSVRQFQDKPVEREILDTLVEIAETAPSSKNSHSTGFMIVEDKDTLEALSQTRESGSKLIAGAPAAIVVMGDTSKTDLWVDNAAISATFIQLAAVAMDLGSCWVHINGRPRSKTDASRGMASDYVNELLGIKEDYAVLCIIALGYEA